MSVSGSVSASLGSSDDEDFSTTSLGLRWPGRGSSASLLSASLGWGDEILISRSSLFENLGLPPLIDAILDPLDD